MPYRVETNAEPIPGYRLIERLGGGGFGEVWKAEAPGGLLKAIKFVYGDIDECGEEGMRAEQELKSLSRVKTIRHPYILSLERYEIVDGQLCIVMELADRNLWDRFKECRVQGLGGIPRDELLDYMTEVAEALDLMNMEYQLQHLDIKPQNLFLVHNHIKIADFGLVKDLEGMVAKVTGGVTPIYAAPETFDGWVSRFSDQYSLAIVYQELLTGHRPYSGTNVRQLIVQHMTGTPDLSVLPASDRSAIARALAKKPEDRFPTCKEMVATLRQLRRRTAAEESTETPTTESQGGTDGQEPVNAAPMIAEQKSPAPPGVDPSETSTHQPKLCFAAPMGSEGDEHVATHCLVARPGAAQKTLSDEAPRTRGIPPSVHGDGVLFPALIVGLGEMGLKLVLSAREKLAGRFGNLGILGQLRFLCIDTNPQVLRQANQNNIGLSLTNNELLITRLNRPSHYLRNREGRANLDNWFDTQMLYRISRGLETGGVRALGRLAFCDHFSTIARVLRQELEQCTEQEILLRASRDTQLGMRSNRPRVYIACSLMGGTGGGMFIDTAYLVRSILRRMGYDNPEVVGLFLMPHVDRGTARTLNLGNACAALKELAHFSVPGSSFSADYGEKDESVRERGAPFMRSFLLQMRDPGKDQSNKEVVEVGAEFLTRELVHPMGRTADFSRAELPAALQPPAGAVCHTFGLERFTFPRRLLVQEAARSVCRRLLDRWISKDARPVLALVEEKTQQYWAANELSTEGMIQRLLRGCERLLQKSPEAILAGPSEPVLRSLKAFHRDAQALAKQRDDQDTPTFNMEPLDDLLLQIEELFGRDGDDTATGEISPVPAALARTVEDLVAEIGQKLAESIVAMIEKPDFRLAGAEEAVRQFIRLIEKTLDHHEPLCKELTGQSSQAQKHVRGLMDTFRKQLAGGRKTLPLAATTANDLAELFRHYPKWRYQALVLQQFSATYVSLRGNLSDLLREINQCRARLVDLRSSLGPEKYVTEAPPEDGRVRFQLILPPSRNAELAEQHAQESQDEKVNRYLFPEGAEDLEAAVKQFLKALTAADIRRIEDSMQTRMTEQLNGLVDVCLAPANLLGSLETLMHTIAENALHERLAKVDVGELFLEQYPEDTSAGGQLSATYEHARPIIPDRPSAAEQGIAVLGVPRGRAGDRIRQLCVQLLGKNSVVEVASEDVSIYRERCFIKLADLEQLGPLAQEAYRQMLAVEHFTPHTRLDIQSWKTAAQPAGTATAQVG